MGFELSRVNVSFACREGFYEVRVALEDDRLPGAVIKIYDSPGPVQASTIPKFVFRPGMTMDDPDFYSKMATDYACQLDRDPSAIMRCGCGAIRSDTMVVSTGCFSSERSAKAAQAISLRVATRLGLATEDQAIKTAADSNNLFYLRKFTRDSSGGWQACACHKGLCNPELGRDSRWTVCSYCQANTQ